MRIIGKTGVRVIHDYMRHKQDQVEKFEDLLAMEQQYCRQEPFVSPGALHPCDGPETGRLSPTGVNTMRDPAAGAPPTPAYITTAGKDLPTITTR